MKKLTKRILAGVLCGLFILSGERYAFAGETYTSSGKNYTFGQILSDYQYFSFGDLKVTNHTVGAVAVGGTAELQTFGDGAIASSYLNHIKSVGNYTAGGYLRRLEKYNGYVGKPVYYNTSSVSLSQDLFMQNGEYMNFATAKSMIIEGSNSLVQQANVTLNSYNIKEYRLDGQLVRVLVIPFSKTVTNVTIPADTLAGCDEILICGVKIEDFVNTQYTINCLGSSIDVGCDYANYVPVGDAKKAVYIQDNNGATCFQDENWNVVYKAELMDAGDGLLKMSDGGSIEAGQMHLSGMKFVWNFPDATSVNTMYLLGHVIAPKATVTVSGGNFEGGIIGNSIVANGSEGHFYPYYAVETCVASETPVTTEVPVTTETPVTTEVPVTSETPVTTEIPATTQGTVTASPVTSSPATSTTPTASNSTYIPVASNVPTISVTPVVTSEPTTTEEVVTGIKVVIIDKETKEPIPSATVIVKNNETGEEYEDKTNEKGEIYIDETSGSFTIIVIEVPEGYETPDDLTIIISSGENEFISGEIIIYDENEDLEDGAVEDSTDEVDEEDVEEEDSDTSPSERVISRTSGVVRGRHSSSPKTGEGNGIMIFVGIAIVSGVAIVYVKKKNVCKQDR